MLDAAMSVVAAACLLVPFLAASLTATTLRRIVLTTAVLALMGAVLVVVGVATGDDEDFYDIGRQGALILGLGVFALAPVFGLLVALLGRVVRVVACRLRGRQGSLW